MNKLYIAISNNKLIRCWLCQKQESTWLTIFYTGNYWHESEYHVKQDIYVIESESDLFSDFERITDQMERSQGFICQYTGKSHRLRDMKI